MNYLPLCVGVNRTGSWPNPSLAHCKGSPPFPRCRSKGLHLLPCLHEGLRMGDLALGGARVMGKAARFSDLQKFFL